MQVFLFKIHFVYFFKISICRFTNRTTVLWNNIISMAYCKTAVVPLLTHCRCCDLALSYRYIHDYRRKYAFSTSHGCLDLQIKISFTGMGIFVLKIRRSRDRPTLNMEILILVRRHFIQRAGYSDRNLTIFYYDLNCKKLLSTLCTKFMLMKCWHGLYTVNQHLNSFA